MSTTVLHIPVGEIAPDPDQPRRVWLPSELDRLAASIKARGILQPLRVLRDEDHKLWRLVCGESRWRAAKLALLDTVPCIPVTGELSEAEILADQLIENSCRQDLTPIDFARGVAKLKALKGYSSQEVAAELGISGASVTRAESLLSLPEYVQTLVYDGKLPESAAYEISRLKDEQAMRELAQAAVSGRMKRDEVIRAVRAQIGRKGSRAARVAGTLDGVAFTFATAKGELTPDLLLKAIDALRSKLKEMKTEHKDVSDLPDLLRAS